MQCEEENTTKRKGAASNGGGVLGSSNDWFVFVGVLRPRNIDPRWRGESGVANYPKFKNVPRVDIHCWLVSLWRTMGYITTPASRA
jgi:hypothetical protein